jgi:hypothetical protein
MFEINLEFARFKIMSKTGNLYTRVSVLINDIIKERHHRPSDPMPVDVANLFFEVSCLQYRPHLFAIKNCKQEKGCESLHD